MELCRRLGTSKRTNQKTIKMQDNKAAIGPKPVKERDNIDLLELVCQLHSRALNFPSEEMHNAYVEARKELETRLSPVPVQGIKSKEAILKEYVLQDAEMDLDMYESWHKQESHSLIIAAMQTYADQFQGISKDEK